MEDFMWGELPKQRSRKEERFSTPVLTMIAIEKVGAGRKFVFNKAAQSALEIVGEDRISFGFDKVNNIIAVRKSNTDKSLQLTKTCTVSNKEWYEFIAKHFGLNIEEENNFDLVPTNNYFTLSLRVEESSTTLETEVEENATMEVLEETVYQGSDFGIDMAVNEEEVVEVVDESISESSEEEEVW